MMYNKVFIILSADTTAIFTEWDMMVDIISQFIILVTLVHIGFKTHYLT